MAALRKRPGSDKGKEGSAKAGPSASRKRPGAKERTSAAKERIGKATGASSVEYDDNDEYVQLMRDVEHSTQAESLYVPPPIEGEPPELPYDWSTITGRQLQMLHGAFATFALRVGHLEKLEQSKATICRNAAEELVEALLADYEFDKDETVTRAKAKIEQDPNVKKWRSRQRRHEAFALSYKHDREGYQHTVEALSRLHSMRKDEWEMTGSKSGAGR